jgi:hypothetical protein
MDAVEVKQQSKQIGRDEPDLCLCFWVLFSQVPFLVNIVENIRCEFAAQVVNSHIPVPSSFAPSFINGHWPGTQSCTLVHSQARNMQVCVFSNGNSTFYEEYWAATLF